MDIYIKPQKKVRFYKKNKILLQDVAEVSCPKDKLTKINNIELLTINPKIKANYTISVTEIVDKITQVFPDCTVNNLGEADVLIDYEAKENNENAFIKYFKIIFVSIILFTGSSTAIMTFHSESQINKIFSNYYKIFLGVTTDKPMVLSISYSIGLCLGILIFFNNFFGKKVVDDPTPIEVELVVYEESVTDTIIDALNTQEAEKDKKK